MKVSEREKIIKHIEKCVSIIELFYISFVFYLVAIGGLTNILFISSAGVPVGLMTLFITLSLKLGNVFVKLLLV